MTIEQARKKALAARRKANPKERGEGLFWEVISECAENTFLEGFDAAVKTMGAGNGTRS